jgi:adenylate kinase
MYLVMLGPPGAGKGTQAEQLQQVLQLPHVASGDLFRENIHSETDLGMLAKGFIDNGELVPDDVTIAMIRERLDQADAVNGVILDGFPRTIAQAEGLDGMLQGMNQTLNAVLYLSVPEEELVRRISGRWICSECQTPYHTHNNPPANAGVCDLCEGKLYQREDDKPETVRARLEVYYEQTAPLIDYYREAGVLIEVAGAGDIHQVREAVIKAVRSLDPNLE